MSIKDKIKEIEKLRQLREIPFRKVRIKQLKNEILTTMPDNIMGVGNYVLIKGYHNKDKNRPYLAIYTRRSYKIFQIYQEKQNTPD
jgi:hypothetical protein